MASKFHMTPNPETLEFVKPHARRLILKEGQEGVVELISKDGTKSIFKIEAGYHKLWIMETGHEND